jgi:hypothetical protein
MKIPRHQLRPRKEGEEPTDISDNFLKTQTSLPIPPSFIFNINLTRHDRSENIGWWRQFDARSGMKSDLLDFKSFGIDYRVEMI